MKEEAKLSFREQQSLTAMNAVHLQTPNEVQTLKDLQALKHKHAQSMAEINENSAKKRQLHSKLASQSKFYMGSYELHPSLSRFKTNTQLETNPVSAARRTGQSTGMGHSRTTTGMTAMFN